MDPIYVMVNGLPGNVAKKMADHAAVSDDFILLPYSLTGQEIEQDTVSVQNTEITLIRPDVREKEIQKIQSRYPEYIAIDYTHPTAVNGNAQFYTMHQIPFVMGTTGGDREKLEQTVKASTSCAVIAPNMAKQIVGLQAMFEYAAVTFPGLFKGFQLKVAESHQQMKADTSGTAKAIVASMNQLGCDFDVNQIEMIRDPEIQEKEWKIPKEHLGGHGWHTYTLTSPDGSTLFEFKHNINGRDIYVAGTYDAVCFLNKKIKNQDTGQKLYTMIDVLSGK